MGGGQKIANWYKKEVYFISNPYNPYVSEVVNLWSKTDENYEVK